LPFIILFCPFFSPTFAPAADPGDKSGPAAFTSARLHYALILVIAEAPLIIHQAD
jgi:hypothetical protein